MRGGLPARGGQAPGVWWLSAVWLSIAWAFSTVIIGLGLPISFWMFDQVPAIITLARTWRFPRAGNWHGSGCAGLPPTFAWGQRSPHTFP
ncbi:MAG: hypothetical protein ACUVS4_00015 [Chloroflexaceae bacterium]